MIRNYFFSAIRNLWKSKLYSLINIGGLALGLSVTVLILLFVYNELSYNQWIPDKDQVYRVIRYWPQNNGGTFWTPDPLAEQLVEEMPEIQQAAGLFVSSETMLEHEEKKFFVQDIAYVDSTFFDVLSLPLKIGSRSEVLEEPNAVVISEHVANLFFGDSDPIDQTLRFNDELDLVVKGVLKPVELSHLGYDVYLRFTRKNPSWNSNNRATYIKVNPESNIPELERKITESVSEYKRIGWEAMNAKPGPDEFPEWRLQALTDIHLNSANIGVFGGRAGDKKYVYIFGLIAFIVLLIASINYINLSTARALGRAREVGVRKVSGARRSQLVFQFLTETVIQAFVALLISIFLIELCITGFNEIVNRELTFLGGNWPMWIISMLGLSLIVGLLAGAYPAFIMSSFQPTKVLKSLVKGKQGTAFRKGLVVTQFSLSVVLVIVMLFIYKQINYMMDQELGFSGDQVVVIPFNTNESYIKFQNMESEFLNIPGVYEASNASRLPGHGYPDWAMEILGKEEIGYPRTLFTGAGYDKVLGLEIVEGRYFSDDHPSDTVNTFVVNEAFIRENNIEDYSTAQIKFSGEEEYSRIIGVVKDYHFQGLDRRISPLVIGMLDDRNFATLLVSSENLPATMSQIEKVWAQVEPVHPMRSSFLDEDFSGLYEEYRRFGKALLYATFLAVFIAILGLFGLATYSTYTRIQEIGVRKVLGATVNQLSFMLVSSFIKWVLLAGIIATPVGYLISNRWLEDFAYRTSVSPLPFIGAIGLAIILAAITVSFQAIWASTRNPVEALRYE